MAEMKQNTAPGMCPGWKTLTLLFNQLEALRQFPDFAGELDEKRKDNFYEELHARLATYYLYDESDLGKLGLADMALHEYGALKKLCRAVRLALDVNFISLGFDCFPAGLVKRWGLELTVKQGGARLPFDLGITPHRSVLPILRSEFANFKDCEIRPRKPHADIFYHPHYGIIFNHERPAPVKRPQDLDNFRKIIIPQRISDFYKSISSHTIFVINIANFPELQCQPDATDLEYLESLAQFLDQNFHARLVVLNRTANEYHSSEFVTINYKFPGKAYTWYLSRFWLSPPGVLFELEIVLKLLAFAARLTIMRASSSFGNEEMAPVLLQILQHEIKSGRYQEARNIFKGYLGI